MAGEGPVVGVRAATPGDSEFCYGLHRAATRDTIEVIWGWDEAFQRGFHERGFDPSRISIVTVDGRDAGMVSVDRRPGELYLARIELHPDHQGRGIGSRLGFREVHRHGPDDIKIRMRADGR